MHVYIVAKEGTCIGMYHACNVIIPTTLVCMLFVTAIPTSVYNNDCFLYLLHYCSFNYRCIAMQNPNAKRPSYMFQSTATKH